MSDPTPDWGVNSEHGRLLDVLLCPPDNFRWLPTSAISLATLEAGHKFDLGAARRNTPSWSLPTSRPAPLPLPRARPGPSLPGVRPRFERRDATRRRGHPAGAALEAGRVRAGDPLLRGGRDPDPRHDQRRHARGRRRDDPRARAGRHRRRRGPDPGDGGRAARRLARRGRLGGAGRADRARWVHIDVLVGLVAERLVAAAVDALSHGFVTGCEARASS